MARQLPVINAPIVQSTSEASASSVMERDSNGDVKAARPTATVSLVSEGGLKLEYDAKTADYTATENEFLIACTAAALRTVTLPAAASSDGMVLAIKKTDTTVFPVLVDGNASETIDGVTGIYLTLLNETLIVQCDAAGWHVLDHWIPEVTTTKAAAFSVDGTATRYLCTMGSAYTITLPPAAYWKNKRITFVKVDATAAGAVLDGDASETIHGATTKALSSTQWTSTEIISDGTSWYIVATGGYT